MNPIKVKAYGVAPVTKRTYFIIQAASFSLLGVLLALTLLLPISGDGLRRTAELANDSAAVTWLYICAALLDWAAWILAAAILAGAIETVSMLARFRAAESASSGRKRRS